MFLHTFGDFLCCYVQVWAVFFGENRLEKWDVGGGGIKTEDRGQKI